MPKEQLGSYSERLGTCTASWIISTLDKATYVTAGAISPGDPLIQSSYRTEILGVLGVLEELLAIYTEWKIQALKCNIFVTGYLYYKLLRQQPFSQSA